MQFTSIKSGQVIYPYKMYGLVYLIEVASYASLDIDRNQKIKLTQMNKKRETGCAYSEIF